MIPWDGAINADAFGAGFGLAFFVAFTIWAAVAAISTLRRLSSE